MGEDYTWPTWDDLLFSEARLNGWTIPEVPRWKRLPVIRHIRVMLRGNPHIEDGHAYWMANMIWRGHC